MEEISGEHRRGREDEAFYLLEGAIEVNCGDRHWEVGPGKFVFLPRGIPHSFVVSAGPVRGLQITAPAGFERFISELGTPAPGPPGRRASLFAAVTARPQCR